MAEPSRSITESTTCRVIANGRCASRFRRAAKEPFVFTAGRLWDEGKNVAAVAQVPPTPAMAGLCAPGSGGHPISPLTACTHARTPRARGRRRLVLSRSNLRAPGPVRAVRSLGAGSRASPGAPWCSATSRACVKSGGDAAIFVPPDDTDALADAIDDLIGRPGASRIDGQRRARARLAIHARPHGTRPISRLMNRSPTERRQLLRFVIFTHSLVSDWNHGNAHFLRGVATELIAAGHERAHLRAARRLEPPEPDRAARQSADLRVRSRLSAAPHQFLRPRRTRPRRGARRRGCRHRARVESARAGALASASIARLTITASFSTTRTTAALPTRRDGARTISRITTASSPTAA